MKNYKNLIKHWEKLSLHEKRMTAFGSIAIIILIAYVLIWAPLANNAASLRDQIVRDGKLLIWMQSADNQIQSLQKNVQPSSQKLSKSLLGLVQNEVNQSPFSKNVTGLRQSDKESVQLNFSNVSFDEMIKWLIQIWQKEGLQIIQMNVVPATETGLVTMEIIFKSH